jgi:hypothetical protein
VSDPSEKEEEMVKAQHLEKKDNGGTPGPALTLSGNCSG